MRKKACNELTEIINIVPIAPSSVYSRKMIRELWASPEHQNDSLMTTLFLVGLPSSSQFQAIIDKESKDFHDIIQVAFIDSYLNLTLKTLSILHWTENFCPNASWILKSDEDVFVNAFALKDYLHSISNGKFLRKAFVCRMNNHLKVCRSENECLAKWIIPKTLYPGDYYPAYCNGPAYVISSPLARKIFESANKTHPFLMEDVYYTGILAKDHDPRYISLSRRSFPSKVTGLRRFHWSGKSLFISDVEKVQGNSRILWNKILENYHLRKK
ncbi:beta-1,3-galactosyltransferase 2-like [Macrobrachium nipponense]|uniref:beta-1,3-galactosyltransferase 2-like n=1 Tax=Macrobrachium nipponense TaxID=159736 RepID=UPI0030C85D89